jgi:signal transduction histidine kinase
VLIEVDPRMPALARVDKLRFERILANLLENAREHGGGPIRVAVEPQGKNGMVLSVDDAGPGVARGERSRIFERFARGSAARHRVGTGLGLSLVAEHAHAHNGEAWVEDRPGGGARFQVSFAEVH